MLFRANAKMPGYDTLHIDSLKFLDKAYPGQIFNVDVFAAAPEANVIYRFDSRYDPVNLLGRMKNRPVGLEYMGNDHKSILLSFPLYYLDAVDAHNLIHFVMKEKFSYPVGITQTLKEDQLNFQVFPNPVKEHCNVSFNLTKPGRVMISLVSLNGRIISECVNKYFNQGRQSQIISTGFLTPGLYQVLLQLGKVKVVSKIIRQP
jgi:hypothetical protein